MVNRDRRALKKAIGVVLILVCMLIVLGYSTVGNQQSAHALAVLQSPESLPSNIQVNFTHSPSGDAHLVWNAKQMTLSVKLEMSGLASNSTANAADIDKGSCGTTNSGLVTSLEPVVPEAKGRGHLSPQASPTSAGGSLTPEASPAKSGKGVSKTELTPMAVPALKAGIPSNGWFIAVHNGSTLSVDKTAIACGDITNFNTSTATNQVVDLALGATKDPNQAANGVVTLAVNNNQLTIAITMSGLVSGSKHQAHIHQGSCKNQGPVVYPLTPVIADMHGTGTSTTTIPDVSAILPDWYVNVHLGATAADLATQTGFDPLVCGDIDVK
jgi:hypothetical protein